MLPMTAKNPDGHQIVESLVTFYEKYVTFSNPGHALALALWSLATYLWPHFDAFPYLVITADTKQAGKTRCAELLSFTSSNSRFSAGSSPAALFRAVTGEKPTLFMDEAEASLSGETADVMRQFLNAGYRKGQTLDRADRNAEGGIMRWDVYCPKVFILIGDVFDTLRDRSIVIRMRRAEPKSRFLYTPVQEEGARIGEMAKLLADEHSQQITEAYRTHGGLSFLPDRDEEIWTPLFAVAQVFVPERVEALKSLAVDMATEKTAPARRYTQLMQDEDAMLEEQYSKRLLEDILLVMEPESGTRHNGQRRVFTKDVLERLYALPLGPWRKFRGVGLTAHDIANMLNRFGVSPRSIRIGGTKNGKVLKGYREEDIQQALGNWRQS